MTRDRLSHVDAHYLRPETLSAANGVFIEAQSGIALAHTWGGGHVASVDGLRFVVPVGTVHAGPNPKYFNRRRGATWLNMLNDQASGLGGTVVAGTPRDSLHVLDVLYDRDGGRPPEMLVTDTASYSDIVFGLLTLAGWTYAPQLADIPDQKLWRIDPKVDYGPFNHAARRRIDLERIRRHRDDILRVVASIHTGAVRAYDVIRMVSRDGRPTPLGEAIAAYGRIPKTLHVLRLADMPWPAKSSTVNAANSGSATTKAWKPTRRPGPGAQRDRAVQHPLPRCRDQPTARRGLRGPRRGCGTAVAVRARPHQHARPLLVPAARHGRAEAAARSVHTGLRKLSLTPGAAHRLSLPAGRNSDP
nr:Tn3 family transposase [Actinopolyspora mortivallis]